MILVVDASAIGAVIYDEPGGDTVLAHVRDETMIAPQLIDYELANIGLTKIRRHGQPAGLILAMLQGVQALNIVRVQVPLLDVTELAQHTGLTAYDASYLWLALDRDAELVTLDRELARADRSLRGDLA